MGKTIEIFQIDAFTNKAFEGNSAAVTFSEDLEKEEMQKIAKEMNLSETAFLSKPDDASADADFNLRWFTPAVEVDLCGHATIASLHFLKEKNLLKNNSVIKLNTLSGILKCRYENDFYYMQIPLFNPSEFKGDKEEIVNALNLDINSLDEKIPFTILENGNLYIYVKSLSALLNIQPDFKTLKELTKNKNEFSGVVVFTLETVDKESFAHSRYFVPFFGIDEDPVTGSTNGPLLIVLDELNLIRDPIKKGNKINLIFEQGDVLKRRGRVKVSYDRITEELYISGQAVTVLKGALTF